MGWERTEGKIRIMVGKGREEGQNNGTKRGEDRGSEEEDGEGKDRERDG